MRTSTSLLVLLLIFGLPLALPAQILIDDPTSFYTNPPHPLGDYTAISGIGVGPGDLDAAAQPGVTTPVLDLQDGNGNKDTNPTAGVETNDNTLDMGELWDGLDADSNIDPTVDVIDTLVFGLEVNETNPNEPVTVTELTITIEVPEDSTDPLNTNFVTRTYTLGTDVNIVPTSGGNAQAEAKFEIPLLDGQGNQFNFFDYYDTNSTEVFTITSTIEGVDDGFERYFLSSAYSLDPPSENPPPNVVPEPSLFLMLSLIVGGYCPYLLWRRKRVVSAS